MIRFEWSCFVAHLTPSDAAPPKVAASKADAKEFSVRSLITSICHFQIIRCTGREAFAASVLRF